MYKKLLATLITSTVLFTNVQAQQLPESIFKYVKKGSIQNIKSTPLPGIYQLKTKSGQYIYIDREGRYAFTTMFDLKSNQSLTQIEKRKDMARSLQTLSDEDVITYPAMGEQRAVLTIFTDTSCPYCTKLHTQVPALQDRGVKVRYAAFPRGGKRGPGYSTMVNVWCSEDRKSALDIAFMGNTQNNKTCASENSVNKGYDLGTQLGINGTPASFTDKGIKIDGYMPAEKILLRMGL